MLRSQVVFTGRAGVSAAGRGTSVSRHRIAAGVLLAILSACGGERIGEKSAVTERDSAGVHIVEVDLASVVFPGGWRISEPAVVRLGSVADEASEALFRIVDAFRLADGRIVVANGGSQELRFYDGRGELLTAVGGEGDGPGEFRRLTWMGRAGDDSIAAFDYRARRMTVLDSAGGISRTFQLESFPDPLAGEPSRFRAPRVIGRLGNGEFLIAAMPTASTGGSYEGVPEDSVTYYAYTSAGSPVGAVATQPANESWVRSTDRQVTMMPVPFGRSTHAAVGPEGFWLGSSDSPDIRSYDARGGLRLILRRLEPVRPVGQADVSRYKQRKIDEASEYPEWQEELTKLLDRVPFGRTVPTFASFLVDDLGYVWVERYATDEATEAESSLWTVFRPDGRPAALLRMPPGVRPLHVGRRYIVALHVDDLEIEHVEAYLLERSPPD
jgi:hypothetical protein